MDTDTERARRVLELADALLDAEAAAVDAALADVGPDVAREVRELLDVDGSGVELESFEVTEALAYAMDMPEPVAFAPDGYELHERIGRGAMGEVYRATQLVPRREVALKRVDGDGLREAQALADASHPAIPAVYAVGETPGCAYVAMELVRGEPLGAWSARASVGDRLDLLERLCRAVHAIHGAGVLHRDLKAANVLVDATGPRLVDFGLAVDVEGSDGGLAGTLRTMADEVLAGGAATVQSDVFSLACLIVEVCTGELAMPPGRTPAAQRRARASWTPPSPDGPLGSIVARGLAEPALRYRTAEALADDLHRLRTGRIPHAHAATPVERLGLLGRRHRRTIGWAVAVLAALSVGAGWPVVRQVLHERAAEARVDQVLADGQGGTGGDIERLTGLLALEVVQGTDAADRARLARAAAYRTAGDTDRELEDLALVFAAGGPSRPVAASRLAGILAERRQWSAVDAVWPSVPDAGRRAELSAAAGAGLRDAQRDGLPGMVGIILRGRRTAWRARELWPVDGGFVGYLPGTGLVMGPSLERQPVEAWEPGWGNRRPLRVDGSPLLALDRGDGEVLLVRGTPEDGSWGEVASLTIDGKLWRVASSDFDGDGVPTFFLGTAAHPRSLWVAEPPSWVPRLADASIERTDADVQELRVMDLDGDAVDELVVHLGPWTAHDVRVYTVESGGALTLRARQRLGGIADVAALPVGEQTALALVKHDAYPNPSLFGRGSPMGVPAGLYVYALEEDGLALRGARPLPDARNVPAGALVGDLDGDGDQDVVVASRGGSIVVELDARGNAVREHWIGGLTPLAVANVDGDPADELLVTLEDSPDVWALGVGDMLVPPVPDAMPATDELEVIGLYGAAARRRRTLADLAPDPTTAAAHLAESARLHERARDFDASLADLERARELDDRADLAERTAALLEHLAHYDAMRALPAEHRRGPAGVATHELRFVHDLPDLAWEVPTAFEHVPGEGLHVVASSGDGLLARLPLRRTGEVVGVEVDLDGLVAEAGARLHLTLRSSDDDEAEGLGIRISPWGGAGQVERKVSCLAGPGERDLSVARSLLDSVRTPSRVQGRALVDRGDLVCDLALDSLRMFVRRPASVDPGQDLALEIRVLGPDPAARIDVLLRSVRLTGLEPLSVEQGAGRLVVERRYRDALPDLEDPLTRMEVLGRSARLDEARREWASLDISLPELLPAVRRQPGFWLDLLRSEAPDRVPEVVAAGWTIVYGSGDSDAVDRSLDRSWIDRLPIADGAVAGFLLRHASALSAADELERARQVFSRLAEEAPVAQQGDAFLGLAAVEARLGRTDEARRACGHAERMLSGTFLFPDRVDADPALHEICGG
ncbi:MAG: serine/threonine protein kinase [Alphaproteobacteria bacterium]|nr:serine/threonine protein kinase [Alphaproteobacteria bacterium]